MKYKDFVAGVRSLMSKSGESGLVRFSHDKDAGLFTAKTSEGTRITMAANGTSVTVRWGSGHTAMAPAERVFGKCTA